MTQSTNEAKTMCIGLVVALVMVKRGLLAESLVEVYPKSLNRASK